MVEKDTIIKEKVKHTGLGDLKASYKYAREWLDKEGYTIVEDNYSEKVVEGNAKEIEIEWTAWKKITDYFKITIKIKWKILKMTEVEVEIEGKRRTMNKFGEIALELKGILEKDYSSKWEVSPFTKFFKEIYHKYVIPQRTEEREKEVRDIVQDFKEEMKAYFELTGRK